MMTTMMITFLEQQKVLMIPTQDGEIRTCWDVDVLHRFGVSPTTHPWSSGCDFLLLVVDIVHSFGSCLWIPFDQSWVPYVSLEVWVASRRSSYVSLPALPDILEYQDLTNDNNYSSWTMTVIGRQSAFRCSLDWPSCGCRWQSATLRDCQRTG